MDVRVPPKKLRVSSLGNKSLGLQGRLTQIPFRTTNFIFKRSSISARVHTDHPISPSTSLARCAASRPSNDAPHYRHNSCAKGHLLIRSSRMQPAKQFMFAVGHTSHGWQSCFVYWRYRVQGTACRPLIVKNVQCFPQCLRTNVVYTHPVTP